MKILGWFLLLTIFIPIYLVSSLFFFSFNSNGEASGFTGLGLLIYGFWAVLSTLFFVPLAYLGFRLVRKKEVK